MDTDVLASRAAALVPNGLPADLAADVRQEIALLLLANDGELPSSDAVRCAVARARAGSHLNTYGRRSLDARLSDESDGTLLDWLTPERLQDGEVRARTRYQRVRRSPERATWYRIVDRCHNPKAHGYRYLGARGIVVCDRWRQSYEAFFADMGFRPTGHRLTRCDPMGPFNGANCLWQPARAAAGASVSSLAWLLRVGGDDELAAQLEAATSVRLTSI